MGLADRDYMRERARDRAESRGAVFKGKRRPSGGSQHAWLLPIVIMSSAITPWLVNRNSEAPAVTAKILVPANPQAAPAVQEVVVPVQMQAPSPIPELQAAARGPTPELASILDGRHIQDLTHIDNVTPAGYVVNASEFPPSSTIEWFVPFNADLQLGKFIIWDKSGDRTSKVIRLRQAQTGIVIAQAYIRAGDGVYLMLPIGDYVMTVAMGNQWFGKPAYFGPAGAYLNTNQLVHVIRGESERHLLPAAQGGPMTPLPAQQF